MARRQPTRASSDRHGVLAGAIEIVANQQRDALQEQERGYDVKPPARFGLHVVWAMQPFIARAEAV